MLNKQTSWHSKRHQGGSSLLEALIAILIFSMGIIALMGLQAASIKNSIDAKYRADAAYLANQIIAQMWVDRSNIDSYSNLSYVPPGWTTPWTTQVTNTLPGATAGIQSIAVTTPLTSVKQVTVTVRWKSPQETATHNFVTTAQINI